MSIVEFGCLPTIIGSMPHTDPQAACELVSHYLRDIPAWPQLPRRSFRENMYAQYSQGFPGVVIEDNGIYIDTSQDLSQPLEQLYAAYLKNDADKFPISPDYAAGLHSFLSRTDLTPRAVKGQVTGPLTWGLTVTDQNQRAILHDEVLGDAIPKLLKLKATSSTSSGAFASAEKIVEMLEEVFAGISGLKGLHCCGNTDWSVLLKTSLNILSFDAYNYAESLSLYPAEVSKLLERGGTIAWGIVPNDEAPLAKETSASLKDRLEEAMAPFTRDGIPFRQLVAQGLLTPSCGLASLTEEASARALELLAGLSAEIRKRYL